MRIMNGILGVMLTLFALACVHDSNGGLRLSLYALGAVLAFIALIPQIGLFTARMLAVVTTLVMFFCFAGFFMLVPSLTDDWYVGGSARVVFSLLLAGFAMIPVLSRYSCRMKEVCPIQRRERRKLERQMRRLQRAHRHGAHHPWHAG